jgi:hypothetical protein
VSSNRYRKPSSKTLGPLTSRFPLLTRGIYDRLSVSLARSCSLLHVVEARGAVGGFARPGDFDSATLDTFVDTSDVVLGKTRNGPTKTLDRPEQLHGNAV